MIDLAGKTAFVTGGANPAATAISVLSMFLSPMP